MYRAMLMLMYMPMLHAMLSLVCALTHVLCGVRQRMCRVGLFGEWLRRNNYGIFVEWQVGTSSYAAGRCLVEVARDGRSRVPSGAAMKEYLLAMATGDAESRPKGGWPEYRSGKHAKVSLQGKTSGEMMTEENKKEYGWGGHADLPFRYRAIAEELLAIRWRMMWGRCAAASLLW